MSATSTSASCPEPKNHSQTHRNSDSKLAAMCLVCLLTESVIAWDDSKNIGASLVERVMQMVPQNRHTWFIQWLLGVWLTRGIPVIWPTPAFPPQSHVCTPEPLKSPNYIFHRHMFDILRINPPLCINLRKPTSFAFSPGFEKNRFVDIWPSAAWLCPSDATIHAWLYRASHDGQEALQKVRKALFIYGYIVMHIVPQRGVFNFYLHVRNRQNSFSFLLQ